MQAAASLSYCLFRHHIPCAHFPSLKNLDLRPPLREKEKKEITLKISDFVTLDVRPVNIVGSKGFKELIYTREQDWFAPVRVRARVCVCEQNNSAQIITRFYRGCNVVKIFNLINPETCNTENDRVRNGRQVLLLVHRVATL